MSGRVGKPLSHSDEDNETNVHDVGRAGVRAAVSRAVGLCSAPCFPPCEREISCNGLCHAHYVRSRRGADLTKPIREGQALERFGGFHIPESIADRIYQSATDAGVSVSEAIRQALEREALFAQALVDVPEINAAFEKWLESRKSR